MTNEKHLCDNCIHLVKLTRLTDQGVFDSLLSFTICEKTGLEINGRIINCNKFENIEYCSVNQIKREKL